VNDPSLLNDTVLVSEYGDVLTVRQVKAFAGMHKAKDTP
jgi:hypothetical protein